MSIFDMLLSNAMMGEGGGGGGGSSDFSTAQVTVTFESEWCPLVAPLISVEPEKSDTYVGNSFHSGDTVSVILYKGKAIAFSSNGNITSVSGAIESVDEYSYLITGDGTINITGDI